LAELNVFITGIESILLEQRLLPTLPTQRVAELLPSKYGAALHRTRQIVILFKLDQERVLKSEFNATRWIINAKSRLNSEVGALEYVGDSSVPSLPRDGHCDGPAYSAADPRRHRQLGRTVASECQATKMDEPNGCGRSLPRHGGQYGIGKRTVQQDDFGSLRLLRASQSAVRSPWRARWRGSVESIAGAVSVPVCGSRVWLLHSMPDERSRQNESAV